MKWRTIVRNWIAQAGHVVPEDAQLTNNVVRGILRNRKENIEAMGPAELVPVRASILQKMIENGYAIQDENGQITINGRPAEESLTDEKIKWQLLPLRL